jgi:hypothetical protein
MPLHHSSLYDYEFSLDLTMVYRRDGHLSFDSGLMEAGMLDATKDETETSRGAQTEMSILEPRIMPRVYQDGEVWIVNKKPTKVVCDRYDHFVHSHGDHLLRFVSNELGNIPTAISLGLKLLERSDDRADWACVINCQDSGTVDAVRSYFSQSSVRRRLETLDPGREHFCFVINSSLRVGVQSATPGAICFREVPGKQQLKTLCGSAYSTQHERDVDSTIGGLLKVSYQDESSQTFAVTAGLVPQKTARLIDSNLAPLQGPPDQENECQAVELVLKDSGKDHEQNWSHPNHFITQLGAGGISQSSLFNAFNGDHTNFGWSLVTMETPGFVQANLFDPRNENVPSNQLKPSRASPPSSRSLVILTNTSSDEPPRCSLHETKSWLQMSPGEHFISVFPFRLNQGSRTFQIKMKTFLS